MIPGNKLGARCVVIAGSGLLTLVIGMRPSMRVLQTVVVRRPACLPVSVVPSRHFALTYCGTGSNTSVDEEKAKNAAPSWNFALADRTGRAGGVNAVLSTETSLPKLEERALVAEAQAGSRTAFEE